MSTTEIRVEVKVEWTKEADRLGYEWTSWTLIGIYGDLLRLEGRDDDGAPHDGDCIWVHSRLVQGMIEP